MNTNPNSDDHNHDPDRIDILIGRVVDSEASASDWRELELLADADPQLWGRLARAQRAHARLTDAIEDELAIAELVDLPDPEPIRLPWVDRMQRWSGWALAAALCLAWLLTQHVSGPQPQPHVQAGFGSGQAQPIFVRNTTPDDAWSNYIETARLANHLVSELPPILIEAHRLPSGAHQVFYVRRSLEQATLTDIAELRVSEDEQGTPLLYTVPAAIDWSPVDRPI